MDTSTTGNLPGGDGAPHTGAALSWLDALKRTIWLSRPDVQALCRNDPVRYESWLLFHGMQEYRALAEIPYSVPEHLLHEPSAEALPGVRPALSRLMAETWARRPDVQAHFDPGTVDGQQKFVWWFLLDFATTLGIARLTTGEQRAALNEPDPGLPGGTSLPLTRLMTEIWRRRLDLQQAFPLTTPEGREGLLVWYFAFGLIEMGLVDLLDEAQRRALLSPGPNTGSVPRILEMIWGMDPALRERFPDPAAAPLLAWAGGEGWQRYPILERLFRGEAAPRAPRTAARPTALPRQGGPFGVNLIGYARGQFGIGEDVRMAARAMQAAGIPFSIYNVEPGREVCQGDTSVDGLISDRLPYPVNMLCMTGFETARLATMEGAALWADGRYTIGYWPWELPEWPREWFHAYVFVDEIWASSRYTFDSYVKSCPKPVRHVPMAVAVDDTEGLERRDFGLPEDRFMFVFAFDVLSSFSRKNPMACVEAFRQAFPNGDEPVGIVVKSMRASAESPAWRGILDEARRDRRITVIGETLSRSAVRDLYRACDCFVSLHRSEGFGRGIAEAMMLGKPVIVTGHSGNMDFTTPGTAALVEHGFRHVVPGEYMCAEGQVWAEPDVKHAAWWMRRLAQDRGLCDRMGRQGQLLTNATYSPAAVGAEYAVLLRRLMP